MALTYLMRVSEMRQPTCRRRLVPQRKGGEDERAGEEEVDDCVGPEPAVKSRMSYGVEENKTKRGGKVCVRRDHSCPSP
jgi:hypothetical protein